MNTAKTLRRMIFIFCGAIIVALLLMFSPFAAAPPRIIWYYALSGLLYLLMLGAAFLRQLQIFWRVKHKSFLEKDGSLIKKRLPPTSQEIKDALLACFTRPKYIITALMLAAALYANYWAAYNPQGLAGLPGLLFDYDADGRLEKNNVWLAITCVSVLFLCLVIIRQGYQLKQSSKLASRQNLIINAHSSIALANLRLIFTDINRMFLSASKLEYILNAKPIAAISQAKGQALLNFRITLRLNNDYSLTEFYIRQLSIFVGDMVIECDNYQSKFYQIFAIDNEFVLNFYIRFSDVNPEKLAAAFTDAEQIKVYYNFVVKNSFSVITDMYGSALYEQTEEQTAATLDYVTKDARANQYFYI